MMERCVLVYIDLEGEPIFVGRLWSRYQRGRETASFEYDSAWLSHPWRFALEPALSLDMGQHHTGQDKVIFGSLGDSAPDRWGRILMRRAEKRAAREEERTARTLLEIDYLLMVNDEARQGALRFRESGDGAFLAPANQSNPIPPLVDLPRLLSASDSVLADKESDTDLRLLLAPGSSLGGARPKASVRDRDGHLAFAKFPHPSDEFQVEAWESLLLTLAEKAGLAVPVHRLERIAGQPVLILRRFDRTAPGSRLPFLSAMGMLSASDNEAHSYLEIADSISRYGARPEEDRKELWRRIVFNVLVSNTDDHLRNHGFLHHPGKGWTLTPAYDLNPVPVEIRPRIRTTMSGLDDPEASLELALENASYFGLGPADTQKIISEVAGATKRWRMEARSLGIREAEIERMASAFEHYDAEKARQL